MDYSPVLDEQEILEEELDWQELAQEPEHLVYAFHPGLVAFWTILVGAVLATLLLHFTASLNLPAMSTGYYEDDRAQAQSLPSAAQDGLASLAGCAVNSSFPASIMQWCEVITYYANQHGLPVDLVAALILQESNGDPNAYSRSGAVGLMQIMPRDGLAASFMCANGPCFSDRPSTDELRDPEFNVAFGTKMLAGLLKRYGDLREALRSYGPKDVGYYYADKVMGLFQRYSKPSP